MTIIFSVNPENQFVTTAGEGFCVRTSTDANKARGIDEQHIDLVSDVANSHPMFSAQWWQFEDYPTKEAALAVYPNAQDNT